MILPFNFRYKKAEGAQQPQSLMGRCITLERETERERERSRHVGSKSMNVLSRNADNDTHVLPVLGLL